MSGQLVNNSGTQKIELGGTASSSTIAENGTQDVHGTAKDTKLQSGGTQNVYQGSTVTGTTFDGGGTQVLRKEATMSGQLVNNSGTQKIELGGTASSSTIAKDGTQDVYGTAKDTKLQSGGTQNIAKGGTADSTNIENGGKQNIADGGKAISTTIQSGGEQNVQNGGIVSGAVVKKGGTQNTEKGAIVTDVTVEGDQNIKSGSVVSGGKISSGGTQEITDGGKAVESKISGTQNVQKGAEAEKAEVNNGGTQQILAEGKASETVIKANGRQIVNSGATAKNTRIEQEGRQIIEAGANIQNATFGENTDKEKQQGVIQLGQGEIVIPKPKPVDPAVPAAMDLQQKAPGAYNIGGTLDATHGGTVVFSGKEAGATLTIENMKGDAKFQINTDIATDKEGTSKVDHITIKNAETDGNHKIQINYDKYFDANITSGGILPVPEGGKEIAEVPQGTTMEAETTEWGAYRYTPTLIETTSGGKTHYSMDTITEGDLGPSELVYAGMETAAGSIITLRQENEALSKRIGELRANGQQQGIWAKIYGGKQKADSVEGRQIEQSGSGLAVGYDNKISEQETGTWYMGYTVGYLKNSLTMEKSDGNTKSLSFGIYGAWEGKDGTFGNITLKQSRLSNDYSSFLKNKKTDSADYSNWGTTLGAEYGYRKQLKDNTYIEPTVSLTYGKIGSASYMTKEGTNANIEAMNSFVGKLGLTYGKQMGQANGYVRFVAAREFSASAKASMYKGMMKPVSVEQDFKQSWLEFALGISGKTGDNSSGYLELMRTSGGKTHTPWQISAGLRWSV